MEDEGEQAEVMALMHSGPECPAQFSLIGDTCYLQVKEMFKGESKADKDTHWSADAVTAVFIQ